MRGFQGQCVGLGNYGVIVGSILTIFFTHVKRVAHLPFTSEAAGSSLSENFLNATRTQS